MAVEDPGTMTVTCDECGEQDEFETSEYQHKCFSVSDTTLKEHGWKVLNNGAETYCPRCRLSGELDFGPGDDDDESDLKG